MRALAVIAVLLGIVVGMTFPRIAFAQNAPTASSDTPEEAKKKGDEAMVALHYQDALAQYQRAYEATKSPALLYNMGRAYEGLGDFPRALDALEEFNDKAPADLKARVTKLDELLRDIRNRVATLVVSSPVENAEIRLGDKVVGRTKAGQTVVRVNAGKQKVVISRDGYLPFEKELLLEGGKVETVEAVFAAHADTAVLRVTSPVEGASVVLDGKSMGVVPVESPVLPGTHRVALARDGYDEASTSVVVNAGERKDLSVPLAKKASIFAKWWFWTAVGVVVIGVTTTVIVLNTEKDPDSGTIAPGQVRADLRIGGIRF
jgi:hypothetical protein